MRFPWIVLALIAVPLVTAQLVAHSPQDGETVDPATARFTFSVGQEHRDVTLEECRLVLDNETVKTIRINDKLGGTSRQLTVSREGTYSWHISCTTERDEVIRTVERTVHLVAPEEDPVKVRSSGVIRGSLIHEFTLRERPVEVPNVAPGDYVQINLEIPPSTIRQEYFVKGRYVENGTSYFRLTDRGKDARLFLGRNVTVEIGTVDVLARLERLVGNKGTITFFPLSSEKPQEPQPAPDETPPEEPEEPEEDIPDVPDETPPDEAPPEEPRQGFFSWLLSLLTSIFGA